MSVRIPEERGSFQRLYNLICALFDRLNTVVWLRDVVLRCSH